MLRRALRWRRGARLIRGPLRPDSDPDSLGPGSASRHFVPHRVRDMDRRAHSHAIVRGNWLWRYVSWRVLFSSHLLCLRHFLSYPHRSESEDRRGNRL